MTRLGDLLIRNDHLVAQLRNLDHSIRDVTYELDRRVSELNAMRERITRAQQARVHLIGQLQATQRDIQDERKREAAERTHREFMQMP